MNDADKERYRGLLTEQRDAFSRQLRELGADPDDPGIESLDFDFGFADSAQSTAERNKVLAVIERLRDGLHDANLALDKIERGDYGVCERCGQPIAPERLEALPHARLDVRCKQLEG